MACLVIFLFLVAIHAFCNVDLVSSKKPTMECDKSVKFSEKDVIDFLFRNYTSAARPRMDANAVVDVKIGLRICGIHDLIERENTLVIDGYLETKWLDEFLVWNTAYPLACLNQIMVPVGYTWLPDVSLANAPNGRYSLMQSPGFRILLYSDGTVQYSPAGQIESMCETDVSYFPFDKQVCSLDFESWQYDATQQNFTFKSNAFVIVDHCWTDNMQWSIESMNADIHTVTYIGKTEYPHAAFEIVLRRKSLFYCINIIIPSIIISIVELAPFFLPIDEVLKIHISFTCLLAYSVFQGMVIADLPRSGKAVPMLSLYIDLQMAYIGIIGLMGEALVFSIIRKGELKKKAPSRAALTIFFAIGRIFGVHYDESVTKMTLQQQPSNQIEPYSRGKPQIRKYSISPEDIFKQWIFIAEVVETLNMYIYIAACIITPLSMFTMALAK